MTSNALRALKYLCTTLGVAFLWQAGPTRADTDACLAAPTQACVFDLAISAANAQTNPHFWAMGMMQVGFLQESVGDLRSAATLDAFTAELPRRMPETRKVVYTLWLRLTYHLGDWLLQSPVSTAKMAELLSSIASELDDEGRLAAIKGAIAYTSHTPAREDVFDMIPKVARKDQHEMAKAAVFGLSAHGDIDALQRLFALAGSSAERDKLKSFATIYLIRQDDVTSAKEIAATITDPRKKVDATLIIMRDQFERRRFVAAREIARELEDAHGLSDNLRLRAELENFYAGMGAVHKVTDLLASRKFPSQPDAERLLATAAMAQGQLDPIFTFLEGTWQSQKGSSFLLHKRLLSIYAGSGQRDMTRFLEYYGRNLPRDRSARDLVLRLEMIAAAQAQLDDLENAELTLYRADFVLDTILETQTLAGTSPERLAVEKLMIAKGRTKDAVHAAFRRGDAVSLAIIATLIK